MESKQCPKCFGYGHMGKPLMLDCDRCNGIGVISTKKRAERTYKESAEQGNIAGYIKKKYPDIMFETVEREGKRSNRGQNAMTKNNSNSSWPDTRIYVAANGYHSLMIENKKLGTELFQKRTPNKFASEHFESQYKCHRGLIERGHAVYFGIGVTHCIEILERYLNGNPMPFLDLDYQPHHPIIDSLPY